MLKDHQEPIFMATTRSLLEELLNLTPAERIELAQELWGRVESDEMPPPISEQKQEIER